MVALTGCVFGGEGFGNDHFKAAGEACRADNECSSQYCYGGLCEPGGCKGADSDCPTNYKCLYDDGDPIFGLGAGYYCALACGTGCPERWECEGSDQTCFYLGPEVTVTADVAAPVAGQPVTFTATISPDVETTFKWHFTDQSGAAVGSTESGETCTQTFDAGNFNALVDWATTGYGSTEGLAIQVCAAGGCP
jgi:hypothetical protein